MRRLLVIVGLVIGCGRSGGPAGTTSVPTLDAAANSPASAARGGGSFVVGAEDAAPAAAPDAAQLAPDADAAQLAPDAAPAPPPPDAAAADAASSLPSFISPWPGPDPGPPPIPDPTAADRCWQFIGWYCQLEGTCAGRTADSSSACSLPLILATQQCRLVAATGQQLYFCEGNVTAKHTCADLWVNGTIVLPDLCRGVLILRP